MLSGLSSAQHKWELVSASPEATSAEAKLDGQPVLPPSWSVSPYLDEVQIFDEQDYIVPLHPVYAVPVECVADIKSYFERKQGF